MRGLALLMLASSGVALRVAPIHLATGRNVATLPLPTMQMVREDETPISAVERKYNESPTDISGINLPVEAIGATDVVLIFHGRGGPDRETDDLKARFISQDAAVGLQRFVDVIDWQSYMEGTDRLSFTGQAIGRKFGRALARQGGLRSIHVVGTSAGAFAANEVCSEYIAITSDRPRANVRLSLTDPFTARGGENLNNGWGLENFGRSAGACIRHSTRDRCIGNARLSLFFSLFCFLVHRSFARC